MSYFYFYIGHIISLLLRFDCMSWLYCAYNWFMIKSNESQDKTGKGPWKMNYDEWKKKTNSPENLDRIKYEILKYHPDVDVVNEIEKLLKQDYQEYLDRK